jgi:1-acyl-sn-glycerol-3-phosphate acyltransferase
MDSFKDIRPYQDDEIRSVIDSLLKNSEFVRSIASFYYPRLTRFLPQLMCSLASKRLKTQLKDVHDVASMQDVIAVYMDKMIEDTTTGLTNSGMENLGGDKSYLFISNHRDIAMDPAFVNYMLYHAGFETLQIAIGDNLLKKPFVTDLMRLNKSFIVMRSLKGRELLKSLTVLSEYIHHCIETKQNVWIAQREGRAKDGIDKTDPTLLKMLAMAHRKRPLSETLAKLHIVPIAISYEYDTCDKLKAEELYQIEKTGSFAKTDKSDIDSIVMGMIGYKGHVHVAFGNELVYNGDDPEQIAELINEQITENYQLRDSNYIALEKLRELGTVEIPTLSAEVRAHQISESSRVEFEERLAEIDTRLHTHYLSNYANAVITRFSQRD